MAEDWDAIAAEIAGAIGEVGFACTIRQPGILSEINGDVTEGVPTEYTVNVIDDRQTMRDSGGMVTGIRRVLTVEAGVVEPVKGWHVVVNGKEHRIAQVMPLAPGGTAVLYDLDLEA